MENSDYQLYRLFDRQRNLFVDELRKYDPSVKVILNWKKLEESNIKKRKNWFTCFIPKKCGKPKKGFGIHFGFVYQRDRKTRNDYVRLIVGTEKPLDPSFNNQFKNEVVEEIKKSDIDLRNIALYPNAGVRKGGKLLEIERVPLNGETYKKLINGYKGLTDIINIISIKVKEYHKKDRFMGKLELKE